MTDKEIERSKIDHRLMRMYLSALVNSETPSRLSNVLGYERSGSRRVSLTYDYSEHQFIERRA